MLVQVPWEDCLLTQSGTWMVSKVYEHGDGALISIVALDRAGGFDHEVDVRPGS